MQTFIIRFSVLLLSAALFGCGHSEQLTEAPTLDENVKARAEVELAEIRTEVRKIEKFSNEFLPNLSNDVPTELNLDIKNAEERIDDPYLEAYSILIMSQSTDLLDNDEIKKLRQRAAAKTAEISDPLEKANRLLTLAEVTFGDLTKKRGGTPAQAFSKVKRIIQEIDAVAEKHAKTLKNGTKNKNRLVMTWEELNHQRNILLSQMAKMQIWTATLEDVWDTILYMDNGQERDEVVGEVIEMLLETGQTEETEVWIDEMTDEAAKKRAGQKIKNDAETRTNDATRSRRSTSSR